MRQKQDFIVEIISIGRQLVDLKGRLELLKARWDQNPVTQADVDALEIDGLTKNKLSDAIDSLDAVRSALGDYATGAIIKLVKLM